MKVKSLLRELALVVVWVVAAGVLGWVLNHAVWYPGIPRWANTLTASGPLLLALVVLCARTVHGFRRDAQTRRREDQARSAARYEFDETLDTVRQRLDAFGVVSAAEHHVTLTWGRQAYEELVRAEAAYRQAVEDLTLAVDQEDGQALAAAYVDFELAGIAYGQAQEAARKFMDAAPAAERDRGEQLDALVAESQASIGAARAAAEQALRRTDRS